MSTVHLSAEAQGSTSPSSGSQSTAATTPPPATNMASKKKTRASPKKSVKGGKKWSYTETSQLIWGYCRKFFGPAWTYDMIIEEFKFKRSNLACRLQVHKFFRGNVPQTEAEMHAWFQARGCRAPRASASATRAAPKQLLMAPPKPQQQQQPTGEAMAPTFEWCNRPTEANPAKQPAPFALTGSL